MERESFENQKVAELLNDNFVSIKGTPGFGRTRSNVLLVDREERPDIDQIYMTFVQATTGSGGWPLNVFLTPDLEPIFGGTYFAGPDVAGIGRPSFTDILERISELWKRDSERAKASGKHVVEQLREYVCT